MTKGSPVALSLVLMAATVAVEAQSVHPVDARSGLMDLIEEADDDGIRALLDGALWAAQRMRQIDPIEARRQLFELIDSAEEGEIPMLYLGAKFQKELPKRLLDFHLSSLTAKALREAASSRGAEPSSGPGEVAAGFALGEGPDDSSCEELAEQRKQCFADAEYCEGGPPDGGDSFSLGLVGGSELYCQILRAVCETLKEREDEECSGA